MKQGEFRLISLGVAMKLPKGYEAHVVPRSSTYKNFGLIQANHMGVIGLTLPPGSSDLPESRRAALCFLFGLASDGACMCPPCYQDGGSLLHCLSTLGSLFFYALAARR